jgi:23S rRNA (cytidine1920-2'-O)/16S rRNA (cytidine1409-2'-O)-methyltransferase
MLAGTERVGGRQFPTSPRAGKAKMIKHRRIDLALVEEGLFESRAKAQEAITLGQVTVDGAAVRKSSARVALGARLAAPAPYPYVSRGGVKLAAALADFAWTPAERVCLDVGASTGGFCDVLIRAGAATIYAVDVGHGQLHPRIAACPQVVVREGLDARNLQAAMFAAKPSFIVCDVSFISLKHLLPPVLALAATPAQLIAVIKPQFEVGRRLLKKGVVRDSQLQQLVCTEIATFITGLGWSVLKIIRSPISGGDGNGEFLIGARRD